MKKTFLDIHCKSGSILEEIIERLLNSSQFHFEFNRALKNGEVDSSIYSLTDVGKRRYLIDNNIYAVCPDCLTQMIVTKELTGDPFKYCSNIIEISSEIQRGPYTKGKIAKETLDALNKVFKDKRNDEMIFDVVVGNPPYNDGMDIDFVFNAFNICGDYTLMVTPAKWQTAEANQGIQSNNTYGLFREKLAPHMKEVIFYPNCKDVFDNAIIVDGITYYILSKKQVYDKSHVFNKCVLMPILECDGYIDTSKKGTLSVKGYDIINYIKPYNSYEMLVDQNKRFRVIIGDMIPGAGFYRLSKTNLGLVMISPWTIYDSIENKTYEQKGVQSGKLSSIAKTVFSSDDLNECLSFISWMYSKFTRFFLSINISTRGWINTNAIRYIPEPMVLDASGNRVPGKFDHIYTDAELYKTFDLPQEYINVIEAVIKERKL